MRKTSPSRTKQNAADMGFTPCLRLVLAIRNMNKVSGFCFSDVYYINSFSNNARIIALKFPD